MYGPTTFVTPDDHLVCPFRGWVTVWVTVTLSVCHLPIYLLMYYHLYRPSLPQTGRVRETIHKRCINVDTRGVVGCLPRMIGM